MSKLSSRKLTTANLTRKELGYLKEEAIIPTWKRAMLDAPNFPTLEQIVRVTLEAKLLNLQGWLKLNRPDFLATHRLAKTTIIVTPPDKPSLALSNLVDAENRDLRLPTLNTN